jgi:type 1 glutamine amidotransferase
MKLSRALTAAAIVAVAMIPIGAASADRGDDRHGKPDRQWKDDRDRGKRDDHFRALIFSKTAAFRHTECIPQGTARIAQMSVRYGFDVDATENAALFTDENLAKYDVVIFLCTTGDVLNATQQAAFERYIQAGGGYAGIHSASDTEYDWPWYGGLVGAYFRNHPQIQVATMNVEDRRSAATRHLGRTWTREEEWYNFRTNPRDTVHVLLSVDESTYDPGSGAMGDHPISWCQPYDGGRAFYTALGHRGIYWDEPDLLRHVLGGIRMAAGVTRFDCGEED